VNFSFLSWIIPTDRILSNDRCIFNFIRNSQSGRALAAHACNPSYSGGRDQENCSSKPGELQFETSPGKQSVRPYLEKNTKKDWWSGLRCRFCVQALGLQNKQTKPKNLQTTAKHQTRWLCHFASLASSAVFQQPHLTMLLSVVVSLFQNSVWWYLTKALIYISW
jgi:hypothetical protein